MSVSGNKLHRIQNPVCGEGGATAAALYRELQGQGHSYKLMSATRTASPARS